METFVELSSWRMSGILVTLATALLYWYAKWPYNVWRDLNVMGPQPVVFLGNLHEMFDPKVGFRKAINHWQKEYGRVFGVYFFRKPVLVVTDPEVLKQVFVKDFNIFVDRFFVGDGKLQHNIIQKTIFFAEGRTWRRLRKLMTPTFSSGKLKLITKQINSTASRLGKSLEQYAESKTPFQAKSVFGAYALDVIAAVAFGIDTESQENLEEPFIKHAKSLMTGDRLLQLRLFMAGAFPACIPLLRFFNIGYYKWSDVEFFQRHLKALVFDRSYGNTRKEDIPFDFLRLLMEAESDANYSEERSALSKDEVVAQCLFFLIAGYETTSSTLQYLAYELAKRPDIQEDLLEEILRVIGPDAETTYEHCPSLRLCEAVVEETLRLYPPVHILTRQTSEPIVLGDIALPAHTGIAIPVYNIGRDPEFYEDPDDFKPERFSPDARSSINHFAFAPFGLGPRQCIGMRMAMMELKLALVHMLRNVVISGATPSVLDLDDYSGLLAPKIPIEIMVQKRIM